jgi:hypothetical protein
MFSSFGNPNLTKSDPTECVYFGSHFTLEDGSRRRGLAASFKPSLINELFTLNLQMKLVKLEIMNQLHLAEFEF